MASSPFAPPSTGPVGAAVRAGGDIMDMAQLLTIRAELSPETLHVLINDASGHHAVRYRSRIDAALVGISNMYDLGPSDPLRGPETMPKYHDFASHQKRITSRDQLI